MKKTIQQKAFELGFDACHFTTANAPDHAAHFEKWIASSRHGEMGWIERNAPKRVEPQLVLQQAKTIICLAVSYSGDSGAENPTAENVKFGGRIARYARYTDYHNIMGERLKTLTEFINQFEPEKTKSLWYVDTGPLLERDLAQRAGMGFAGKHTNLISRELGNWIFLSEIITTLDLEPDAPEKNRCGSCTRCIVACPTQAITAPFELDARRCISYLTIELKGAIPVEFRRAIGNRIYGCDDCLAACPWNRFARAGNLLKPFAKPEFEIADLLALLELDDDAFRKKFAGTPMLRTKRRGLLRNVCVALGNIGDATALPALRRAALDKEPLIVEHALWALEEIENRIGRASRNEF